MSTPVVERPRAATRTAPARTPRAGARPAPAASGRGSGRPPADVRAGSPARAPFVLTVMVLLGIGLVATLWLSTAAAADSYRLRDARAAARDLSERTEHLHREVAALQSPPALAQRAAEIGMVPAKDPARLVVGADGSVTVVGEPAPAVAPPAVAPPTGLDGGLPAVRSVPAPELVPQQVAAAAVAVARPVVEQALADAAQAAQEEEEAAREAAGAQDTDAEESAQESGQESGRESARDDAAGDGDRRGAAGNGADTDGDGADRDRATSADRSDDGGAATTGTRRAGGG